MIQRFEDSQIEEIINIVHRLFYMNHKESEEKERFTVFYKGAVETLLTQGYEPVAALIVDPIKEEACDLLETIRMQYPMLPIFQISGKAKEVILEKRASCYALGERDYEELDELEKISYIQDIKDKMAEDNGDKLHGRTFSLRVVFKRKPGISLAEFVKDAKKLLILDSVSLPLNICCLYETAIAMDVDGVIFTGIDLYNSRVGNLIGKNLNQIPWMAAQNWPDQDIKILKENGFKLVAMALKEDSIKLNDESLEADKIAILMGNEMNGLEEHVIDACDHTVMIPMSYGIDSLNVTSAAAIAMRELFR